MFRMSMSKHSNQKLWYSSSNVAVIMADNVDKSYNIVIDSCQTQQARLRLNNSDRQNHTKSGTDKEEETSSQTSLQSQSKDPTLSETPTTDRNHKKTSVECRKIEEQPISLKETDIDKFFTWQWNRLYIMTNQNACLSPNESTSKECSNSEHLLGPAPQTIEALYFHLKAKQIESGYWADQFLLLVGRNLDVISKDPDFLCLDLVTVSSILRSDYLDVLCEKDVFNAGYRWIQADSDYRMQHVNEVLAIPRYALMTPEEIVQCVFRSRPLVDIVLGIPSYPQAILRGVIAKHLVDLDMTSNCSEFEAHDRFTIGDTCTPMDDPSGSNEPKSLEVNFSTQIVAKQVPAQKESSNVYSGVCVQICNDE